LTALNSATRDKEIPLPTLLRKISDTVREQEEKSTIPGTSKLYVMRAKDREAVPMSDGAEQLNQSEVNCDVVPQEEKLAVCEMKIAVADNKPPSDCAVDDWEELAADGFMTPSVRAEVPLKPSTDGAQDHCHGYVGLDAPCVVEAVEPVSNEAIQSCAKEHLATVSSSKIVVPRWRKRETPDSEPVIPPEKSDTSNHGFWSPRPKCEMHAESQSEDDGRLPGSPGAETGLTPRSREVRKLRKALREITDLEAQALGGKKLRRNQFQKIAKKERCQRALEEMEVSKA